MSTDLNFSTLTIVSTTPTQKTITILEASWTNITELTLLPVCWCLTILLTSLLLFCYRRFPHLLLVKKGGLSTPMLIFLTNHLVNNSVFLFSQYILNNVANINRQVIDASGWLNTWWSFWVGNYTMAGPCTVSFVVMDRFLALMMNFKYTPLVQKRLRIAEIIAMVLLYSFSLMNVMVAWPYVKMCNDPGTENNPVPNRPCLPLFNKLVNYTQQTIKVYFACVNLVVSILFFYHLSKAKIANVRDGIVKMTIFGEMLFDVMPGFLSIFFSAAQIGVNLNVYLFLMSSSDAALCSVVYAKILFNFHFFKSRPELNTITQVSSRLTGSSVRLNSLRTKGLR